MHVTGVKLDIADRGAHIRDARFEGEPAGQAVTGVEVELEIIPDTGLVLDIDVGPLVDGSDRWEPVITDHPFGQRDIGVAPDIVDGGIVGYAETELPLAFGVLCQRLTRKRQRKA